MRATDLKKSRERLEKKIEAEAFVRASDAHIVSPKGELRESGWLFDLRNILLRHDVMQDVAALFWQTLRERGRIQIGCIETAGALLAAALIAAGPKGTTGFFIRKGRKKDGLMKTIEGTLSTEKIVLVDDLMNSGKSLVRQVEVLEAQGHRVDAIWILVRFRDEEYYAYFKDKNIPIISLFTLDDFTATLGTKNLVVGEKKMPTRSFTMLWKFESGKPAFFHVVPKSDPAIDEENVYMGSDDGVMWGLRQEDGSVAWSYRVGFHPEGKGIFSSPAVHDGVVYFVAYDGNVYALDAKTGNRKWISYEADWVGSSPAIAEDLGLLFVGLEFGLWRKRGGIVALDLKTGKKKWGYSMPLYTHSSPLYIPMHRQVVIGSNDGSAYLFDAQSGTLVWKFDTMVPGEKSDAGFGKNDIKESFAYFEQHDVLVFGTIAGRVYFIDRTRGTERAVFSAGAGFYSTPLIVGDTAYIGSLDKYVYALDIKSGKEKWRWYGGARIFASPALIEGSIFIGANTGRCTELDPRTGEERSYLAMSERITNRVVYNPRTKRFFIPTHANEIYCVERA